MLIIYWSSDVCSSDLVGLPGGFDEVVVRGDPDKPGFSIWYLCENEVLCMETVNNPLESMQAGRWIGAHAKVDPRVLKDHTLPLEDAEIGRAHVRTPVTNAHIVCRLLLENKTLK